MNIARDAAVGLPRAYLHTCLLLLLTEGPSHGYELLEEVQDLGLYSAEAGGLYRALRSMDEAGQVRSRWEPSESGPARRTYEITPAGRVGLDRYVDEAGAVAKLLNGLVNRHCETVRPS
ncbi:hypothetical protein BH20ACT3_BH20ACT3_02620 [soil metagenome]